MRSVLAVLFPWAAAALLRWLAPIAGVLTAVRVDAHQGGDPELAVVHLAALVAWLLVCWLLAATATALIARLPGVIGRTADAVSRRITPALVRRAIGGSAALGIVVGPALAPTAALAAGCAPLPPLDRTATACSPATTAPIPRASSARHSAAGATPADRPPPAAGPLTRTIVAGDTLWALAATELGAAGIPATPARIAARWPAWWQANRTVIGDDPDLIHVGAVLSVPHSLEKTR